MTDGSEQVRSFFSSYKALLRKFQARTTVRLLQSCVRIAQGHARLMCRKEVGEIRRNERFSLPVNPHIR